MFTRTLFTRDQSTMLGCNPICTVFYSSFFISYFLFLFQPCYASYDYLTPNQTLIDGQILVSAGENFTLGFFSPHNSQHRYLGIWYTKISVQTVVWLANRDNPIPDSTGILKIVDDGNLQILYGNGSLVWSSNTSVLSKNPIAQLLDSGNLVLGDGPSSGNVIWQSYDEPTDSFLPGMRLGLNRKTGKIWKLISWKSPENPSSGNYTFSHNKEGSVDRLFEGVILEGSKLRWRTGSWDGRTFIGIPIMETTYRFGLQVVDNIENGDLYLTFSTAAFSTRIENYLLNSSGFMNYRYWNEEIKHWVAELEHPGEKCEIYGFCGPNGNCDPDHSPICSCLYGFEPKSAGDWTMGKWSDGCVRRIPLGCEKNSSGGGDGFLTLVGMKIPDRSGWIPASTEEDCVAECRKNCSCVAYLHTSGLGCFVWVGDLMDVRKFPKGGLDFYVRLAGAELEAKGRGKKLVIVIVTIVSVILICGCIFFLWMRMAKKRESKDKEEADVLNLDTSIITSPDTSDAKAHGNTIEKGKKLLMLDLHIVAIATDNFSITNKLGEGGFGAVYKGILPNGKEIAVKRLSRCSCQGLEEFKNEVIIIAKLQHRNLVRLLGCCIDRGEKLLVYDYMPNKSLDGFLFDETKRRLLDWRRRFIIIEGIARGLLYLHRDSRLRIIHRDLKPSNILLDDQMNPKISDFGMARIFGGNQSQANTKRIVGTYGYMSPEYAMEGRFSEKSDVFSFGIILLEIVSGKTNNMFHQHSLTLTGYAWMLWNDDNGLELVDPLLCNSFHAEEVLKCIHVALLCVQESANNRPTISSILSMLGSEATILPTPKKPAFFIEAGSSDTSSSMNDLKHFSKNDLTTSTITGR